MTFSYAKPVRYNERGQRVKRAQLVLQGNNRFAHNFHPGAADGIWGRQAQAAADDARFWLGYPLAYCPTGGYGQKLHDLLTHLRLSPDYAARHVARRGHRWLHQAPGLPGRVHYPGVSYPPAAGRWGLQPWIVPQVEAICDHFGLSVTAGWGGHPPHGYYSDHRWGGAVDLAGSYEAMVKVTLWADRYASGYYRRGAVFRWVGGPAHDANGVEPGHYNHFHGSWFREGPPTSIFRSCPEFAGGVVI